MVILSTNIMAIIDELHRQEGYFPLVLFRGTEPVGWFAQHLDATKYIQDKLDNITAWKAEEDCTVYEIDEAKRHSEALGYVADDYRENVVVALELDKYSLQYGLAMVWKDELHYKLQNGLKERTFETLEDLLRVMRQVRALKDWYIMYQPLTSDKF